MQWWFSGMSFLHINPVPVIIMTHGD